VAALNGTLTDRIRIVRTVVAGPRVEGRSQTAERRDTWWPARLVPGASREAEDAVGGRRAVALTGELWLGAEGQQIRSSDRLIVRAMRLGDDATWTVTGLPEVLRGRRDVLAVRVPVERLVEPPREATPWQATP
jgi:hypothetical protein